MSCILILRQLGTLSVCVIYCRGKPQRQVALGRTYTATQFYAFYNRVKISSNCMCEMSGGSLLLIYLELSEAETFTFCCFIVPNRYIMPVQKIIKKQLYPSCTLCTPVLSLLTFLITHKCIHVPPLPYLCVYQSSFPSPLWPSASSSGECWVSVNLSNTM